MRTLWKYLKPHKGLIIVSLLSALLAQLLSLIDPIIFGKIIDDFATGRGIRPENELVRGVLFWLALAIAIALLARLFRALQEYLTRMAVAHFGMNVFDDGLKQTLRLSFQECLTSAKFGQGLIFPSMIAKRKSSDTFFFSLSSWLPLIFMAASAS